MKRLSAPLDVQIELTERCNQICKHCYNYWRHLPQQKPNELQEADFINIIRQLHQAKVGLITFSGGEPMLRKDILFNLITEAHLLGIETGLNSNGALVGKEDAKRLARCGLEHTLISILGPKELHNSIAGVGGDFVSAIRGISFLIDFGIPVAVNMPVSKLNIHSMRTTAELVKNLGVKSFCAGPIIPSSRSSIPLCLSGDECKKCLKELIKIGAELSLTIDVLEPIARCLFNETDELEFVRFFGNRICSAAVSSCAISSAGNIRPCIHSDVSFGSVLPDEFLDVWQKMVYWASPSILPDKCHKCNALMVCEGGCRMSAKITSGDYNDQDMYMTEPISDPKRAVIISSDDNEILLQNEELLTFNKRCIFRKEEVGYVAYINGRVECLTSKGFDFVSIIRQLEEFSCRLIAQKTEYSEDTIAPILKRLIRAMIINRKERDK
ncbi:MAG: radical SAM protein [Patescibacteria group bacterium]